MEREDFRRRNGALEKFEKNPRSSAGSLGIINA